MDELKAVMIAVALLVVPVAGNFLVAWLRQKTEALTAARIVGRDVAASAPDSGLTAEDRERVTVERMQAALPHLSTQRATAAFRQVAPELEPDTAPRPRPAIYPPGNPDDSVSGATTPKRPR